MIEPTGPSLTGMPHSELQRWLDGELNCRSYRAHQLFSWIHNKRVGSFQEMTNISGELRSRLARRARLTRLLAIEKQLSGDGTTKLVQRLPDGRPVEAVLIPDPPRLTACLSTQVGCRMGCQFCQTGRMGFIRDMDTDEIVAQLYALQEYSPSRISNVVLMGMGEPMDNLKAVIDAIGIITDDRGICIGARKITISTVGVPDGIRRLADAVGSCGLAVSLHSAVQSTREMLVPAARRWPLEELAEALVEYVGRTGRRPTLEYCVFSGLNDTLEQARALAEFAGRLPCKINLIHYNPVEGCQLAPADDGAVDRFASRLYANCPAVTVRRSRGRDISAACGQLGSSLGWESLESS